MKGIVLSTEDGFVVLPHAKVVFQPSRDHSGQWRATITGRDQPSGWFGPAFATEAEARALCRAAAVALADGTGGVFGEPAAEVKPELPLKVGDRVTYIDEGPRYGDRGVVTVSASVGFDVQWGDEDDECEYEWADVGLYVTKADEPAQVKPDLPLKDKADEPAEVKPEAPIGPKAGPKVGMVVNWTGWGHEDTGIVVRVHDRSGAFKVFWDKDDRASIHERDEFNRLVTPA